MDITHQEFDQFRNLLHEMTGISLSVGKKASDGSSQAYGMNPMNFYILM